MDINVSGRGMRGENYADILRRTGTFGVLPTDTDEEALEKVNSVALQAADDAENYANMAGAFLDDKLFVNTAAGIAATTNGQYFIVAGAGDTYVTLYRNNAGVAVAGPSLPSKELLDDAVAETAIIDGFLDASRDTPTTSYAIDKVGGATAEAAQSTPSPPNSLWVPTAEPAASTYFDTADTGGDGATELIALWEALRTQYSSRITRTQFGTDESGAYPLWVYTIAPRRESRRKILVNCGTHGGEITGMLGVLRAVQQLLGTSAKPNDRVRFLNDYVTLMIVPVLNPWGLSQSPRDRNNVNFVDLNRNYDFDIGDGAGANDKWAAYDDSSLPPGYGTKGSAALSEAETTAITDLIDDNLDLYRAADVHGFVGAGDGTRDVLIYNPVWYLKSNRVGWRALALALGEQPVDRTRISTEDIPEYPSLDNSCGVRGIECNTVEYVPLGGESLYNASSMTRIVKFHGNVILELACGNRAVNVYPSQALGGSFIIPAKTPLPTTETEIAPVKTFTFDTPGILMVFGDVTVQASSTGETRFAVKPSIGQDASVPDGYRYSQQSYNNARTADVPTSKRATIPMSYSMPVRSYQLLRMTINIWTTLVGNDAQILGGQMHWLFVPSAVGQNPFYNYQINVVNGNWTERVPSVYALLS